MRVLFINTNDKRGGAAIAANRLKHVLVRDYQAECFSLVAYGDKDASGIYPLRNKATQKAERALDIVSSKVGLQYQFFPFSSLAIRAGIRRLKPDVISLHNTHGGYFETSLLKSISRQAPVVWTLHDMWSFTGNAAHTFGDESWAEMKNAGHLTKIYPAIGLNTGSFLLRQKSRIYRQSDLAVVTPSQWLYRLARKSPVFSGKEIRHIHNGVDLTIFRPYDKAEVRATLNIPADGRVLMFSGETLKDNLWKGGEHLIEVLKTIGARGKGPIHAIITGAREDQALTGLQDFTIHATGYIDGEQAMARYLAAADVFLYPTRADNLPNVLIEAIACGTPCVSFDIGGCKEIVQHGVNGVVIEPFKLGDMAEAVLALLYDDERRKAYSTEARRFAEKEFSVDQMARSYHDLFVSRISEKKKVNT